MNANQEALNRLRGAIKDRALYLALLYRSFAKALAPDQAEKLARQAIFEYGRFKGLADGRKLTAGEWVSKTVTGENSIFSTEVVKEADCCKEIMNVCPLLDAWRELDCTPEEIDLFCDIAMEADFGRADYHGIPCQIPLRMGKGDEYCCIVLGNAQDTP